MDYFNKCNLSKHE